MKIQLIDSVKNAVDYIITNENYKSLPEIDVMQGSEIGDGYASKTYAISINGRNGKTLNLFVKYLPDTISDEWKDIFGLAFQTEFRFYNEIYPAFSSFQEKKNVKVPFKNVPKYYGTNIEMCAAPPIILENLRSAGYSLRDRKKPVDDNHLKFPIQAFARYHALSYAIKDQDPDLFKRLSTGVSDFFTENFIKFELDKMTRNSVDQFLDSLDPVSDKKFVDHCKNLSELLIEHTLNFAKNADEYSVIGQGDCWCNNMMFLYDDKTGLPVDVKLIDWQCQRVNSPLLDFSYFFYTLANKEALDNAKDYLKLYYDTLSQRIKDLGSNPEKMYPYDIFVEHWRKFSLFGLTMAFCIVKLQLFEKDEVPDIMNSTELSSDVFNKVLKNQDRYISRMRDIIEYFIDEGLL